MLLKLRVSARTSNEFGAEIGMSLPMKLPMTFKENKHSTSTTGKSMEKVGSRLINWLKPGLVKGKHMKGMIKKKFCIATAFF